MKTMMLVAVLIGCAVNTTYAWDMASKKGQDVHPGWYLRADSKARTPNISGENMALGESNVRCLCEPGFKGLLVSKDVFVVTKAPKGYHDTLGRRFHVKEQVCLNCSD